ncbi:MAG: preprotein translocase subunit YajC [Verrucomicrobia bacterium]|nr:MAG: preprotein translocase subunit YajC [Verrucomicrobiota bacterium]
MQNSILSSFSFLAEAAPAAPASPGISWNLIMLVLLFGAMWFLLIAPQRKKQKQHAQMLQQLTTGDNVITSGGIFGVITNVKDDRFVIKIADNTRIEVLKTAIAGKSEESKEIESNQA